MYGGGTLHFYTDDYRYSDIWNHPEKILKGEPGSIVEPNFSLFNESPISYGLHYIYKKRWIARALQQQGVRIFVDLNVAQKFYKLNMLGVPLGWRAFATRGYSDRLANLEFEYNLAKSWAKDNNPLFVIYGGGEICRHFAQRVGAIYVNSVLTIKRQVKAIKKIYEGVAFFNEEFSIKGLEKLSHFDEQMRQVEDFTGKPKELSKE